MGKCAHTFPHRDGDASMKHNLKKSNKTLTIPPVFFS